MGEHGRTEAADAVERALTADGARVILRDKHVARTAAALMIPGALLFLLATVAVALGADPSAPRAAALIPFALFAAMAYTGLANMVVRSAVTERELRVQWGLRRITVPLAAITRCEAKPRTGGATAATGAGWSLFADRGSVALTWDEGGAARSALIPAHDPEALARAIEGARGGTAGVRIDAAAPAEEARDERVAAQVDAQKRAR
ncbi:MAG: hypothetical protein U0325_14305 [Polyangiales bacterium]